MIPAPERTRHETLPGVERDPWLDASVRAVFCALDRFAPSAHTDALLERANNIVHALCQGTLTIAESERAIWDALNGAAAIPEERRVRAVRAILTAWINVRPEPVVDPAPPPTRIDAHRLRQMIYAYGAACARSGKFAGAEFIATLGPIEDYLSEVNQ